MIQENITLLFRSLGINPCYKGYIYLKHVVVLATDYQDKAFPQIKELYQQTAVHFNVSQGIVTDDIRTLLRIYWNDKNSAALFAKVLHYPIFGRLTPKEFIAATSEYLTDLEKKGTSVRDW